MGTVVAFPGVDLADIYSADESPFLARWFDTIEERVEGVPLDHAIVILMDESGEQIVYSMNDIRKDQMVGILHIASEQALYGGVAT